MPVAGLMFPTPAESQFIADARNVGVVGLDENIRSAGWMLCESIWENPNHEIQLDVLMRLIQYHDFNQVRLCRGDAPSHRCRDAAISRSTYSGGGLATK
jgi:hypothetical protein